MPTSIPPFANVPAPGDDVKSAWAQQLTQYAVDHVNDINDAHDASAISFAPTGTIAATTVQAAIAEVAAEAGVGELSLHLADTVDAHDASAISFAPTGTIGANNVQAAIAEVAAEVSGVGVSDGDKGEIIVSASGTVWTIDNFVITNSKLANNAVGSTNIVDGQVTNNKLTQMNANQIKGRSSGSGTGAPQDLGPTLIRQILASDSDGSLEKFLRADGNWERPPVFDADSSGIVPASGGGATNFLRADGLWTAPGGGAGGGTPPGGSDNQVQYNNAGDFAGATKVEISNDGNLVLVGNTGFPAAQPGGTKIVNVSIGNRVLPFMIPEYGRPGIIAPSNWLHGSLTPIQAQAVLNGSGLIPSVTAVGTLGPAGHGDTNPYWRAYRTEVTATASTSAIAGIFGTTPHFMPTPGNGGGGVIASMRWGAATGVATVTNRAFCGFTNSLSAPTDVQPSSLLNVYGMGWDSGDANIQFLRNDGAGFATKTDLGAAFPVPTNDRTKWYELIIFIPVGSIEVNYMVIDWATGAVATGVVASEVPAATVAMYPRTWMSAGGTSSVIGVGIMGWDIWIAQ